ncbi:MAG: DNA translocase FtsK [Desulfobacterales bacterium]|nr:DNA translocase FtsK [Desulfobacterales bacterium]
MRKEIIGIFLVFLVIFSVVSLTSYHHDDPSINNAASPAEIHNRLGVIGAHAAGLLVGLFGLGAFWIPALMALMGIRLLKSEPRSVLISMLPGGMLLVTATGALLAFKQDEFLILGSEFSSGGFFGIPLKNFLLAYSSVTGCFLILILMWLIGFILTTGFSPTALFKRIWRGARVGAEKIVTMLIMRKERRRKAKKRQKKKESAPPDEEKKIEIKAPKAKPVKAAAIPKQEVFEFMREDSGFRLPSTNLLDDPEDAPLSADNENLKMQSKMLEKKLEDFGVKGRVVTISPGPVITTFEYKPAPGVKINKIVNLTDDLALTLRAVSIRIVAPIPGKAVIGVEIPNANRQIVRIKGVIVSDVFQKSKSRLTMCLGQDIVGAPVVATLDKMPHLLIAGATGTGKSVGLNAMIGSLLYKASPDEVKLIMVDPKRIELSNYNGIPHLITPVVTDAKKATNALHWAVTEMERRYELLSQAKVKNINTYNKKIEKERKQKEAGEEEGEAPEKLPYIVIIIDELADLMMVASRDVEAALMRLAQMARAAGLHLILATQRPSVDVLTGVIKANFPTRMTFQVSSKTDSRTIIDANGAENLLGAGDMLFLPPGTARLQRIHGAYISEAELTRIIDFLKTQEKPEYDNSITSAPDKEGEEEAEVEHDERYDDAVALVAKTRRASISLIQRHLRIGYNRAARIVEVMEKEGVVGPSDGSKPREVLVRDFES